ncbi:DNA excision repair protein ERCC-6-like [Rhizophlyctis rosea]|uniref:DNA excision repair protein ERCC-6-like n=1 Tax=Rhizophlyctis rosea TaxID=64517 RepID=A0AAD5SHB7_9FUNG|nr:DNA excision repair protein ERCC-6-like [Rhizophlyctis rosea]
MSLTGDDRTKVKRARELERKGFFKKAIAIYKSLKVQDINGESVAFKIAQLESTIQLIAENGGWHPREDEFHHLPGGYRLPSTMWKQLFPHQRDGVKWMWKLNGDEDMGGILGDDMGMGKTIQIISFLMGLFASGKCRHVLIAMPLGLLETWKSEFRRWYPQMRVKVFHGPAAAIQKDLRMVFEKGGVILTTYDKIRLNSKALTDKGNHQWDYVVLDEGHTIKNPSSQKAIAIREIKAKNKLLLTGTPIQNNMGELWALFDYVCNGQLLGTKRNFMNNFGTHIKNGEARDATDQEKAQADEVAKVLRSVIEPYFLRREKKSLISEEDNAKTAGSAQNSVDENAPPASTGVVGKAPGVGALSTKTEVALWVAMRPLQVDLYERILGKVDVSSILKHDVSPLSALQLLQKTCNHPTLLSGNLKDTEDLDLSAIAKKSDPPDTLISQSAKLSVLLLLLQDLIRNGHRSLVFSTSKMMLDVVEACVQHKGIKYVRIDGDVDRKERQEHINNFNKDARIGCFLLTTQVGIGITLTVDPSWNPKRDAQAVDRAYRVGQTKDVIGYRFISCGTIEEKIYRNQIRKEYLARTATDESKHIRYFKKAELKDMFTLDDPTTSKTQQFLTLQHPLEEGCNEEVVRHFDDIAGLDGVKGFSRHDQLYSMAEMEAWEVEEDERRKMAEQARINLARDDTLSPPRTERKNRSRRVNHVVDEEDVVVVNDEHDVEIIEPISRRRSDLVVIDDEEEDVVIRRPRRANAPIVIEDDDPPVKKIDRTPNIVSPVPQIVDVDVEADEHVAHNDMVDRIAEKLRRFIGKEVVTQRDEERADKYLEMVEEMCTDPCVKEHPVISEAVHIITTMDLGEDAYNLVARAKQLDQLWALLRIVRKVNAGGSAGTPTRKLVKKVETPKRSPVRSMEQEVVIIDEDEEDNSVIDLVDEGDGGNEIMVDAEEVIGWDDMPGNKHEGEACPTKRHISNQVKIRQCRCTRPYDVMQRYEGLMMEFKTTMDQCDYSKALELALKALNLCDDDLRLHWAIVTLAKEVGIH